MKRFTIWTMLATVILAIVLLTPGCTSNTGNPSPSAVASITPSAGGSITPSMSGMSTYDSANYTIQYPSSWLDTPFTGSATNTFSASCTTLTSGIAYVDVKFLSISNLHLTLSSYTASKFKTVQNFSNFTQIEASNATLAGYPAYTMVYTRAIDRNDTKVKEIWTFKEGNLYEITYMASPQNYDSYADTAQKMIDSFQIK